MIPEYFTANRDLLCCDQSIRGYFCIHLMFVKGFSGIIQQSPTTHTNRGDKAIFANSINIVCGVCCFIGGDVEDFFMYLEYV